jgi:hypothetical protein
VPERFDESVMDRCGERGELGRIARDAVPETACIAFSAAAGRYFGNSLNRRLLKMAPRTATPNDPPMERKKVALDVAAPRYS